MDISQDFDNQYSRQKTQQKQFNNFQSPNYSQAIKFTQQRLDPKKQIQQNQAKQNLKLADWVWPNGTIPYMFDNSFTDPMKQMLKLAIQEFEKKTPIRFLQISDDSSYNQYVKYYRSEESSYTLWIGRSLLEKEHKVYINDQFPYGTYLHETMHVLGFEHEQCRWDRDGYVSVQFSENDSSQLKDQYEKQGYMIGEYDPDSIMHYALDENMNSKDQSQQQRFGQRKQLSQGDIQGIQFIYGKSLAK